MVNVCSVRVAQLLANAASRPSAPKPATRLALAMALEINRVVGFVEIVVLFIKSLTDGLSLSLTANVGV